MSIELVIKEPPAPVTKAYPKWPEDHPLKIPFSFANPFEKLSNKEIPTIWINQYTKTDGNFVICDWTAKAFFKKVGQESKNFYFSLLKRNHYKNGSGLSTWLKPYNLPEIIVSAQNRNRIMARHMIHATQNSSDIFPELVYDDTFEPNENQPMERRPFRHLRGVSSRRREIPGWAADANPHFVGRAFTHALSSCSYRDKLRLLFCMPDMSPERIPEVMDSFFDYLVSAISHPTYRSCTSMIGIQATPITRANDRVDIEISREQPKFMLFFNPDDAKVEKAVRRKLDWKLNVDFGTFYGSHEFSVSVEIPVQLVEKKP